MDYKDVDPVFFENALKHKTNAAVEVTTNPDTGLIAKISKPVNGNIREVTVTLPRIAFGNNPSLEKLSQEQIVQDLYENTAALFKHIREASNGNADQPKK